MQLLDSSVSVSIHINASPARVWKSVADVASHTRWMMDAVAIRFTSDLHSGVGTQFDCDTKIGPFKLTDRMVITEWIDERTMGVRHSGLVTGTGAFSLSAAGAGTNFVWKEQLTFPWYMGGPVGERVAKPIFTLLWRGNLRRLKQQVEAAEAP